MTAVLRPHEATPSDPLPAAETIKQRGLLVMLLQRPSAVASMLGLLFVATVATFAPWLTPRPPDKIDLDRKLQGPSGDHWLGTDQLGRDVLSRVIDATRVDLLAASQAVLIALVVGVTMGVLAGYAQGLLDGAFSRLVDALMALPPLILAVVVVGTLGPGLTTAMIAIGIVLVPGMYRLARASTMVAKSELYIEAARASGVSTLTIIRRHIMPAIMGPLIIQASFAASAAIIAESSLTFLGLGASPPQATWGSMLSEAGQRLGSSNYLLVPPSVMIVITILSLSQLGDSLRDAMGRRTRDSQGQG